MSGIMMGQVNGVTSGGGGGGGGGGSGGQIQITLIPDNAVGYTYGGGTGVTPQVTAQITGGTAPYALSWTYLSGAADFVISPSASGNPVSWSNTVGLNQTKYGEWKLTVTDFYGTTEDVTLPVGIIDISFEGGGGGGGIIIP